MIFAFMMWRTFAADGAKVSQKRPAGEVFLSRADGLTAWLVPITLPARKLGAGGWLRLLQSKEAAFSGGIYDDELGRAIVGDAFRWSTPAWRLEVGRLLEIPA